MIYNNISLQIGTTLKRMNLAIVCETFNFYRHNKSQTARVLDISVRTLDKYLDEYALQLKEEVERIKEADEIVANFRSLQKHGNVPRDGTPPPPPQVA